MKYQILIKHNDGSTSYLSNRGFTQWCRKSAKKHLREFTINLIAGRYPHALYAAMVSA